VNIQTIIIYLLVKFAAYVWWCRVGLGKREGEPKPPEGSLDGPSLGLGLFRSMLGLVFGAGIYLLTIQFIFLFDSNMLGGEFLAYFLVYIPVRWIEWSIVAMIIFRHSRNVGGFVLGGSAVDRRWRAVGILISCLADIPIIAAMHGNLFLGRIMC